MMQSPKGDIRPLVPFPPFPLSLLHASCKHACMPNHAPDRWSKNTALVPHTHTQGKHMCFVYVPRLDFAARTQRHDSCTALRSDCIWNCGSLHRRTKAVVVGLSHWGHVPNCCKFRRMHDAYVYAPSMDSAPLPLHNTSAPVTVRNLPVHLPRQRQRQATWLAWNSAMRQAAGGIGGRASSCDAFALHDDAPAGLRARFRGGGGCSSSSSSSSSSRSRSRSDWQPAAPVQVHQRQRRAAAAHKARDVSGSWECRRCCSGAPSPAEAGL